MKIKVTSDHIKNGKPRSAGSCPVALAVKEYFPDDRVSVSSEYILVAEKLIDCSLELCGFIVNFDSGILGKPFEFELNYEDSSAPTPY